MIIDIDDRESVQTSIEQISKDWFAPADLYTDLKTTGKTNVSRFWHVTTQMLADVSDCLGCTENQFLNNWDQRCIANDMMVMGYHCTRHNDKKVFIKKGILPLSEETVRLSTDGNHTLQGNSAWAYRFKQSPGPFFFLSYKCAKKPDNHFCLHSPEILLGCAGNHVGVDHATSVPLIAHCVIPYSFLCERGYFPFCVLHAYFNFLDPEDDSGDLFDGYSIDLRGKTLDPKHIVKIEEV